MGVTVATTRVAVNTVTGTQNITTTDLGGLTPKAALLIASYATADGVAADNAVLAVGAVTGAANRWTAWMSDEHAAATSDSYRGDVATSAIRIINPADGTTDGEADFSAWVSNGITLNWTDAPSAAYLLTVVFFAGSDLSAHANAVALGNTVDAVIDVTAPGFRPDIVFTAVSSQASELALGLVHENGAGVVTQRAVTSAARDGRATTENLTRYRNDAGALVIGMGGAIQWYGEFSSFDSSGFSVTTRLGGGNNDTLNYLALSFGGVADAWVGTHTTPTSVNSAYADSGPGFKPQFVLLLPSLNEVNDTTNTTSLAFSAGIIAMDSDEQYTTIITSEDGAADANTQSLSDNVAVSLPDNAGTLDIEATLVSFDTTGWTLNYSNVNAAAKLWPALAIEEMAAGDTFSMSATLQAVSSTQAFLMPVMRPFSDALVAQGQTNAPQLAVVRPVATLLQALAATNGALLAVTRSLLATLQAQSNTNAFVLAVTRRLATIMQIQSVSNAPLLAVLRASLTELTASSSSDTIILSVSGLISLLATLAAVSSANAPLFSVTRPQQASAQAASQTGAFLLAVARRVAAQLAAQSATSNPTAAITRWLVAASQAQGETGDLLLAVARLLQATAEGQSLTEDAALTRGLALLAVLAAQSETNEPLLAITRLLQAELAPQSDTDALLLPVARPLAAALAAQSTTTAIELLAALIVGLITALATAKQPSAIFTARQPSAAFAARQPSATFST